MDFLEALARLALLAVPVLSAMGSSEEIEADKLHNDSHEGPFHRTLHLLLSHLVGTLKKEMTAFGGKRALAIASVCKARTYSD